MTRLPARSAEPRTVAAAIPVYGTITLTAGAGSGTALVMRTDPAVTRHWEPRKVVTPELGGGSTTLDWGMYAVDCLIELAWRGTGQWLDLDDVRQLVKWRAAQGSTYRFQDAGEGDDFVVEILSFDEVRAFGQPRLYTAALWLHVLTMTTLLGQPYTGS
jgi:hypothetical protein